MLVKTVNIADARWTIRAATCAGGVSIPDIATSAQSAVGERAITIPKHVSMIGAILYLVPPVLTIISKSVTEQPDTWRNYKMSSESTGQQRALSGLRLIEDAILELLSRNPQGLRNSEIARSLDLRSDFRGRQRDYLTYSVLGGLLDRHQISWDRETKLFTRANVSTSARESAIEGLRQIEEAILELLSRNPQGLRNSEIARLLGLQSDFRGRQRDYLTYSVLGRLLANHLVSRDQETKLFTKTSQPTDD